MAKKRCDVMVEVISESAGIINVWIDNPEAYIGDILSVAGVNSVSTIRRFPLSVEVDRRYSTAEVAAEIEHLLMAEVPSVFRNA